MDPTGWHKFKTAGIYYCSEMGAAHKIALVVPVYNEESVIEQWLKTALEAVHGLTGAVEIVLVNDGSTDNTQLKLKQLLSSYTGNVALKVINKPLNEGFGAAVFTGIKATNPEYILCFPVDLPLSATVLNRIIELLHSCDVVACYRTRRPGNSMLSVYGSAIYHWLVKTIYKVPVKDLNWVHAYRAQIFTGGKVQPRNKKIFFLAEVLIKCSWAGYSIGEMNLESHVRDGKKGYSQSIKAIAALMASLFAFTLRYALKGKRADL